MNDETVVTVCDTCGFSADEKTRDGKTGGETFLTAIEAAAEGVAGVVVRRTSCLMGCEHPCNVAIAGEGKLAYVLGRFEPGQEAAEAVVEYAALHASSDSGQVPFRRWPQGVKGKFISRVPPLRPIEKPPTL